MEEGLKEANALAEDLKVRSTYEDVMDLKEAYNGIAGTERYFGPTNLFAKRLAGFPCASQGGHFPVTLSWYYRLRSFRQVSQVVAGHPYQSWPR